MYGSGKGGSVLSKLQDKPGVAPNRYPMKRRVIGALTTVAALLIVTLNWRFDSAKVIAVSALTVARLFDPKGGWAIFFYGVGAGDLLLYAASAGHLGH
jgi:hypothetical protein